MDQNTCLRCRDQRATLHITLIIGGETATADLCQRCARALTASGQVMPDLSEVLELVRTKDILGLAGRMPNSERRGRLVPDRLERQ